MIQRWWLILYLNKRVFFIFWYQRIWFNDDGVVEHVNFVLTDGGHKVIRKNNLKVWLTLSIRFVASPSFDVNKSTNFRTQPHTNLTNVCFDEDQNILYNSINSKKYNVNDVASAILPSKFVICRLKRFKRQSRDAFFCQ